MINQQQKDKLNAYAELKQELKLLEAKCDELNPEVLEIMRIAEVEEIAVGDLGKLTLGERRTWEYSLDVESASKYLAEKKKIEERTGKADCTIKKYVIFKGLKEEGNE